MLEQSDIMLISYPLITVGFLGLIFCFTRDIFNIKKGRGRSQNTAPEIYWFMQVLIIVGLFVALEWTKATLATFIIIMGLSPLRKRTKLKED